ncbi:MAG TPA: 4,5-DOPA dioxygenase extradiol, partial [Candidatus Eisenbacteria bacterium]|nr:4,5-DOPA dioxygenase extradiol [Candidatus Eisenbacteria bacterium]
LFRKRPSLQKMPVLFVGHGSPMNAIEHNAFTRALSELGQSLPRPKAVCVVSAHWVSDGTRVLTSEYPRTIHDFYGFPKELYDMEYPAPGAPSEAEQVANDPDISRDQQWGLDHGSWSVLRHMYPKADVPAFQLSLDVRRDLKAHLELGREIKKLRERGVLILGSGNLVHNLGRVDWGRPHGAYDWAIEFDSKVKSAIEAHDGNALATPQQWGKTLLETAHPTVEHYLPVLYCVGSTDEKDAVTYPYEGFDFGSISMRAVLFGATDGQGLIPSRIDV